MNQTDQNKILIQNFIIIRERDEGMRNDKINVVCKTRNRLNLHLLRKGFPSKAARRRFMDHYLKNDFVVED